MTTKKLPTRAHVAFVGLLGLAFLAMGVFGLRETLAVTASNSVATARVVESREMPTRFGMSYDVRYVFSPSVSQPEIGRADFTGRSSLWASLPQDLWRTAVTTGQLQVRYDPRRPTNNAPVDSLPSVWDSITPVVLGSILGIIVVGIERMRHKQTPL
jgi:Protein of unknown function (DUF3592)